MDASTNYLAQAKDTKDGANAIVEALDEEIVVFANGGSNGLKSANKAPTAEVPGVPETSDSAADGAQVDGTASVQSTPADNDPASGLADAFNNLSVNNKPDAKFEYPGLNDYRPHAKYPTISAPPHGDVNGSAGIEWQHQQPKIGRKSGEDSSYSAAPPLYGRQLNASASDFQHRGAPTPAYPGYGTPGAGAYGSYQPGIPPMHGSYVNHGYDVFGVSPTLTEPPVAGGGAGGPNAVATNGSNAPGNRYVPSVHRNVANSADPSGMGMNLNGLGGGAPAPAPYSPIPMSPSPLSLNPYAAHHHAQMQLSHAHMNSHPMGGAYIPPPPGAQAKTDANGAPALGTAPGQNNGANAMTNTAGGPAATGATRGYAPPAQPFNVPVPYGVAPGQQYYDESAMYAGYGAPHMQHGIHHPHAVHPQYQMNPQLGPPGHPGTPQINGYGSYMTGPMVSVPGVGNPGMLPVPGGLAGGPAGQNGGGAGHANSAPGGVQHGANVSGGAANGTGVTTTVNGLTLVNGVPQPNADGTGPSANNRKLGLYKTELCRSWEEKGTCRYGPKCQFAHGEEEIRKVARHPKYKTEICRTFWLSGSCPYGKRCCFIHTDAPTNSNSGDGNKNGSGTGPSTATAGGTTPNAASTTATADGTSTPTHTRTTSTASEVNAEQPPSSLLARISAKRAGEGDKTPSPQGPSRMNPNGPRSDFSHNRHLSSMSDGRSTETDAPAAPTFTTRPGHSHSASAHTLMTPTFSTTGGGGLGFGTSSAAPGGVDGSGNLTPGSFWGHKRSASGSSATNATWSTPGNETPTGTQPEQPLRSIYSSLSPAA